MILNRLLLLSGKDIPFQSMQLIIHPPTIGEISLLGENDFYSNCGLINYNISQLDEQDKILLGDKTNFDIFMSIMTDSNEFSVQKRYKMLLFLSLLFPNYEVTINKQVGLMLTSFDRKDVKFFRAEEFENFKQIINELFCLEKTIKTVNPSGELASKIAKKLAEGRARVAALKGKNKDDSNSSVLGQYASILSIGTGIDINTIMNYTLYQLFDAFERYKLKLDNDIYIEAKMAGATGMKEVENWMKDLYNDDDK